MSADLFADRGTCRCEYFLKHGAFSREKYPLDALILIVPKHFDISALSEFAHVDAHSLLRHLRIPGKFRGALAVVIEKRKKKPRRTTV